MRLVPRWKKPSTAPSTQESLPASSLFQLRSQLDGILDRFLQDPWGAFDAKTSAWAGWSPAVDVAETEKEVVVKMEIPGVEPKDLDISVCRNVLSVAGEKKESQEKKGENFHFSERRFGAFRRDVELPAMVDEAKVDADYAGGVLTVRARKLETAPAKRVSITVAKK
jgi:HSP20 family protein